MLVVVEGIPPRKRDGEGKGGEFKGKGEGGI